MTVKSADKKPEKYIGPDGKPKIRMVSVDKEVVKSEAYNEPQGQAKRIASPLQKARMDKEKADRDKDGKLKSEDKSFKDFREANTPVGQRDKMKIIDRKPHPDGGHIVTMQTKAGKTIKRHLKNGKVKDMTEAVSKLPGGNKHLATAGTKATIMHPVTRVSKKVDKKDLKKHVDAGWKHMGQKRNRVEDTDEGYASDAQRKAVWASKNEKGKKESVAESFDHTDHEDNAFAHGMAHQHHKEHGHNLLAAYHLKASDHHEKALKHYGDGNKQKGAEHARKAMSYASKAYEASLDKSGEHHKVSHDAFVSSMKTIQKTPVTRKEEVELDEISNKTLTRYAMSADNDVQKRRSNRPAGKGDESDPKIGKRLDKINLAHKKGAFKEEVELDEDRRTELRHQSMMFTHAMKQAEFKKKDPRLAKQHDVAGKLHAKAADMHVDNHPDAKKHSDKANKASKLLGEEVELVNEISKKTAQSYLDKTKDDDAFSGTRKANNRLKGAIHAVGKLRKEESVDEVLDTPKAMQSYKDKAKYSRDRASGSAAAKILSKGTLGSHKPELDTMRKRHKGMDMVDRNAKKKTFAALRGNK